MVKANKTLIVLGSTYTVIYDETAKISYLSSEQNETEACSSFTES